MTPPPNTLDTKWKIFKENKGAWLNNQDRTGSLKVLTFSQLSKLGRWACKNGERWKSMLAGRTRHWERALPPSRTQTKREHQPHLDSLHPPFHGYFPHLQCIKLLLTLKLSPVETWAWFIIAEVQNAVRNKMSPKYFPKKPMLWRHNYHVFDTGIKWQAGPESPSNIAYATMDVGGLELLHVSFKLSAFI